MDEETFRFFASSQAGDRRRLLRELAALCENPTQEGDYFVRDTTDRELTVVARKPFLITYWLDAFVREVRVVDVQRVRF
jgi:hypothetical protein